MNKVWIIAGSLEIGDMKGMTQPLIAFESPHAAKEACDTVEKISGRRPYLMEAAFYHDKPEARDCPHDSCPHPDECKPLCTFAPARADRLKAMSLSGGSK